MDALISLRAARVRATLAQIPRILEPITASHASMRKALDPVFRSELAVLEQRLANLPRDGASSRWTTLISLSEDADRLAEEALAFVGGAVVRASGLDDGLCDLADGLVKQFTSDLRLSQAPPTVPAPAEYVDLISDIIRVRFPGGGIWDIPVVLHELGHYGVRHLRPDRQTDVSVKDIVMEQRARKRYLGYYADELFADTFATFVAGPSYAYNCLTSRFSPWNAFEDRPPTHPKAANRALAIVLALDEVVDAMGDDDERAVLAEVRADLWGEWTNALAACGQPGGVAAEDEEYVRSLSARFLQVLSNEFAVARFSAMARVLELAAALEATPSSVLQPQDGDSIVTVLNAGWIARRRAQQASQEHNLPEIKKAVGRLCLLLN